MGLKTSFLEHNKCDLFFILTLSHIKFGETAFSAALASFLITQKQHQVDPQLLLLLLLLLLLSLFQVGTKYLKILIKNNHPVDTTIVSMLLYAQRKCKT